MEAEFSFATKEPAPAFHHRLIVLIRVEFDAPLGRHLAVALLGPPSFEQLTRNAVGLMCQPAGPVVR